MHAEFRLLYQGYSIPFHLPVQELLLSASCAGGLAETLVMAGHPSLQSLTCQLAITEETSAKKSLATEAAAKLGCGQSQCSAASCRMPRWFDRGVTRAVTSYFGVPPIRKVAESQPCCAGCWTRRGMTVPCLKETVLKKPEVTGRCLSPPGQDGGWDGAG